MKVLGVSGSLRRDSHNTELLRATATRLPHGTEWVLHDGLKAISPFNEDEEHAAPPAVVALRSEIAAADAVLFSTPEYNSSIPGHLKNALDWVSRPIETNSLRNKPVAVIGASTGMFGAVWAQAELRKVLGSIGARVVDAELPVPSAHELLGDPEALKDSGLHEQIDGILSELLAEARPAVTAA